MKPGGVALYLDMNALASTVGWHWGIVKLAVAPPFAVNFWFYRACLRHLGCCPRCSSVSYLSGS